MEIIGDNSSQDWTRGRRAHLKNVPCTESDRKEGPRLGTGHGAGGCDPVVRVGDGPETKDSPTADGPKQWYNLFCITTDRRSMDFPIRETVSYNLVTNLILPTSTDLSRPRNVS